MGLLPFVERTVTSTVPGVVEAGSTAVICVSELTTTLVAGTEPKLTPETVPVWKPVPVMTTLVPAARSAVVGFSPETVVGPVAKAEGAITANDAVNEAISPAAITNANLRVQRTANLQSRAETLSLIGDSARFTPMPDESADHNIEMHDSIGKLDISYALEPATPL
jgi:hypothetical protein